MDEAARRKRMLYPQYINQDLTTTLGRRIAKERCVTQPKIEEMQKICLYFNLPCEIQPEKAYPRDWMNPGRVLVEIKKPDGSLWNEEIPNKKQLMYKMGELIPQLKSRTQKDPEPTTATEAKNKKKKKRK
eukprot:Filipodium_phascolosomae@DN1311_c0_g1_i1.p2